MKLWVAPYKLKHRYRLNQHESTFYGEGFLLKLQTDQFRNGYSDCRPWSLWGDKTVEEQIQCLRQKRLTPLLKRSLFFATIDGRAREEKKSLWQQFIPLRSHYTVSDIEELKSEDHLAVLRKQGYRKIKIKLGRRPDLELDVCNRLAEKGWFRWRLDWNGQGGRSFLKNLSALFISQIDFCEDPEPYNEMEWQKLETTFHVQCAVDQIQSFDAVPAQRRRVIKPARQSLLPRPRDIVTNSLDHPIGQSFAALQAQKAVQKWGRQWTDYGLKTDHLFETTPYFKRLQNESCLFRPDRETGIGFDDLLEREPWIPL